MDRNEKAVNFFFLISVDLTSLWYPECSACELPQNRTGMHFFQENPQNQALHVSDEKSDIRDRKAMPWATF